MLDSLAAVPATSIQTVAAVAPLVTAGTSLTASPASASVSAADAKPAVEHLSPSLQLDPEVGIVVIQYRSASGKIELSIPSQQQLDAYAADPSAASEGDGPTTLA